MINSTMDVTMQTCESEPIHIPGAIQPFGVLLSIELPSLKITNASENCLEIFGLNAKVLVKKHLSEFVDNETLQVLREYVVSYDLSESAPLVLDIKNYESGSARTYELSAHQQDGVFVIEIEGPYDAGVDVSKLHRSTRNAVQSLFVTSSLINLCQEAVSQVRALTGFDRVMVYRFTEDWHGDVIAEARSDDVPSYFNHHFPASDIPAQARAVFLKNWLRMIPDVGYVPTKIFPSTNPKSGMPLNLGVSTLRAVSPIHIEYLKNMEVAATLTMPLIDEGRLWGLIACHHSEPRLIASECRSSVKMLAQLVSSQLSLKESMEEQRYGSELKSVQAKLLKQMEEDDLVGGLVKYSTNLLSLAPEGTIAAAIYYEKSWTTVGKAPAVKQLEAIVEWLANEHPKAAYFSTDRLGEMFAGAREFKDIASGLMAISITRSRKDYVLWFRPEVISTVLWAGEPEKRIEMKDGIESLHPRKSFESWSEVIEGVATPWKRVEIEAAVELRTNILAVDLQNSLVKEKAAREMAETASVERENTVHTISHDIRTPLNIINLTLQFLKMDVKPSPSVYNQMLDRAARATSLIERLVTSVLDEARLNQSAPRTEYGLENAKGLVYEAVDLALPLAKKAGLEIVASVGAEDLTVYCQRIRVEQIFGNLISNSLKFTPAGGMITVSAHRAGNDVVMSVADTGIGIPKNLQEQVFDRFMQGGSAREKGLGLGLAIVKDIIEKDGGRIWVDSETGQGSKFSFTLRAPVGSAK